MSDLERAQEWLGCHLRPDSTWCEEHALPWPCSEATRLAALLAEVRAEGWDKGYTSGHSNAMRRMSDEPDAPTTPNPYRVKP